MMDGAERFNHDEVAVTDKRKAYEKKIDALMKQWSAQIALLKARADKAKAEAKAEYYTTIEALQHKRDAARAKLEELKSADYGAWEDLKTDEEKAWSEVRRPFTLRSQSLNEPCRSGIEANLTAMNRRGRKQ